MPIQKNIMFGLGLRLAAVVAISAMLAFVKLAGQHGVHVAESLFWRQLAGLPVVVLWLWWQGSLRDIPTQRPGGHALRMLLGITAMGLNYAAITMLPLAEAATIGFAVPIFATLLAALLLREPTGRYRWAAILLGFVGVVMAIRPGGSDIPMLGAVLATSGALLTGAVTIQIRRLTQLEPTGAIVFWFSLSSLMPLGIAMFFVAKQHDPIAYAYIAGLALSGACAQILLTASLRHAPVAAALTMDYSALLWSVLFGFLIFGDVPGITVFTGAPLIILSGIFILWREHHLAKKPKA